MATGYFDQSNPALIPSGATGTGKMQYIGNPAYGGGWAAEYTWETDEDKKNSNVDNANAYAANAISSSQSGVDAILGRQGDVDAAVGSIRRTADSMLPIAGDLRSHGNAMFSSGTKVTEQALETLGTGLGFMNMDSSSSPLVAEALKLYGQFDKNMYVAAAAQDVQSSFDNARGQTERSLARMGVSPSSGAAMGARSQLEKALATARAAAMTRARERGLTDQATQFQSLLANNANTFLQTGGQLASIGSSMQSAGNSALGSAANALQGAGGLYRSAGDLSLNYGNSLSGAYNSLAGVQNSAANVSLGAAGKYTTSGGGRGGVGGGTNTGRHYGVGGELLETGNAAVDAQLQMARDKEPTTYEKNTGNA